MGTRWRDMGVGKLMVLCTQKIKFEKLKLFKRLKVYIDSVVFLIFFWKFPSMNFSEESFKNPAVFIIRSISIQCCAMSLTLRWVVHHMPKKVLCKNSGRFIFLILLYLVDICSKINFLTKSYLLHEQRNTQLWRP